MYIYIYYIGYKSCKQILLLYNKCLINQHLHRCAVLENLEILQKHIVI